MRLLVRGQFAEEEKDQDGDGDDAEREDDELEEDGFAAILWGRRFGEWGVGCRVWEQMSLSRFATVRLRLPTPDSPLPAQRPVPITTKSGRYVLSCVGASGTTIASLSQTDSQSRQATHFFSSTKAIL